MSKSAEGKVPTETLVKWHNENSEKISKWHKDTNDIDFEVFLASNVSLAEQFYGSNSCQVYGGSSMSGNQFQNCTINTICGEKKDENSNKEIIGRSN